ncbi:MAG: NADH-quinone oxidoreductase subunit NuoB [Bdellovibrionales bacterium]|nr:NADH-quinone oxidoreductase subunit NuoB [Bdellovibrionales bacterium]
MSGWWKSRTQGVSRWARSSAFRYFVIRGACCADELIQTQAARYDLERFGARQELDHRSADVLLVQGAISQAAADELKKIYLEMSGPKWVMAIGSCACSGGIFAPNLGGSAIPGLASCVPVDVYVSGCPPRPEAIIDAWILLQEKVRGYVSNRKIQRRREPRESLLETNDWRVT